MNTGVKTSAMSLLAIGPNYNSARLAMRVN